MNPENRRVVSVVGFQNKMRTFVSGKTKFYLFLIIIFSLSVKATISQGLQSLKAINRY